MKVIYIIIILLQILLLYSTEISFEKASELSIEAMSNFDKDLLEESIAMQRCLIIEDSTNSMLYYYLAQSEFYISDFNTVETILLRGLKTNPSTEERALLLYQLGLLALVHNKEIYKDYLLQALNEHNKNPKRGDSISNIPLIWVLLDEKEKALNYLEGITEEDIVNFKQFKEYISSLKKEEYLQAIRNLRNNFLLKK